MSHRPCVLRGKHHPEAREIIAHCFCKRNIQGPTTKQRTKYRLLCSTMACNNDHVERQRHDWLLRFFSSMDFSRLGQSTHCLRLLSYCRLQSINRWNLKWRCSISHPNPASFLSPVTLLHLYPSAILSISTSRNILITRLAF